MRLPLAPGGNQPTAGLTAADVACAGLRPGDVVAEVRTSSGEQDIPAIAEEHLRPSSPPAEKPDQRAALRSAAELATRNCSARAGRSQEKLVERGIMVLVMAWSPSLSAARATPRAMGGRSC